MNNYILAFFIFIIIAIIVIVVLYFVNRNNISGFFSNTTVLLKGILNNPKQGNVKVYNKKKYGIYKKHKNHLVYFDFFEDPKTVDVVVPDKFNSKVYRMPHLMNYNKINFNALTPYIKKYFTPKKEIRDLSQNLINKYNIDVDNTCMIYYRGTDHFETIQAEYGSLLEIINKITDKPSIFAQSDDTNFLNYITKQYNNVGIFEENTHTTSTNGLHYDSSNSENYESIKVLLAIMLIMAKCKYLIFGSSGNVAYWTVLYRGNMNNVHQPKDRQERKFLKLLGLELTIGYIDHDKTSK